MPYDFAKGRGKSRPLLTFISLRNQSMPRIQTRDGTELFVKDWGTGRPVVLIHGWPLSADSWDAVSFALAEQGFRVVAYDRRGFGRSEQPDQGYEYNTLADDLADLLNFYDLQDVTLAGFSMGGGEVIRYMARHGGARVRSLALVSSVVPYLLKAEDNPLGVDGTIIEQMKDCLKADRPKFFTTFFHDFFSVGILARPVSPETLQWVTNLALQAGLKPTLRCAEAFATTDFRDDLKAVGVPTLIIHGTDDRTVPIDATSRAAATGIRYARLVEYAGAPHGLFATHTDRLVQDLADFLKS
jgi:non-heme chloroperoxidase